MLRPFEKVDLPYLISLERLTQAAPWPEDVFARCLEAGSVAWILEVDQRVIGFIFILERAGEAHILNLCVHPDFQQRGYGFQLLTHVLHGLEHNKVSFVYLEVRRSNESAINLYKKMGFYKIGERKNYYVHGDHQEDALVFAKHFTKA